MGISEKSTREEYFDLLKGDFFALRVEWRLYRSFFGSNHQTVDLLNRISGPTANSLERILFERTLLGIRRLTDPAMNYRGENTTVSVNGLVHFVDPENEKLVELANDAVDAASFARNWANKRIAHSDLTTRQLANSLEPASRLKVEQALDKIAATIKWFASEYHDTHLVTHPIPPLDAEHLFLKALFLGQEEIERMKEARKSALEAGEFERLDELRKVNSGIPAWLKREDPPID